MRDRTLSRPAVFAIAWTAALAVGFLGERFYLRGGWLDPLYDAFQLYVLSFSPRDGGGSLPVLLQVGRFLAPAVTVLTAVEAARVLLAEQLALWWTARVRKHVVVTGDGPAAARLALRLQESGTPTVVVTAEPVRAREAWRQGLPAVVGEAADPTALRAAGLRRTTRLYACDQSDAVDASTVLRVRELAGDHPLAVHARVGDADIAAALRARLIATGQAPTVRLDFFTIDQIAARRLLDRLPPPAGGALALTVVGFGSLGRAVIRETARRHVPGTERPHVTVVHPEPAQVDTAVAGAPSVDANCRVTAVPAVADAPAAGHPTLVCLPDPDVALRVGFECALRQDAGSVVACLQTPSAFGSMLAGQPPLLDDVGGRLTVFDVLDEACDPLSINTDLTEQMARAFHLSYRAGLVGTPDEGRPSGGPWELLDEDLRESNRAQARGIGAALRLVGATVAPESGVLPGVAFTDAEIERLAEAEHDRWRHEREGAGWRHAAVRDNARREHPDLVAWSSLSASSRDKNRRAMRDVPQVLRDSGLQIVRLG